MQHSSDPKSTGARPSLFSASGTGASGSERILNQGFDGGKASKPATSAPRRVFKSVLLLTMLGIGALAIWFVQQNKIGSALKRDSGAVSSLPSSAMTNAGAPSTPPAAVTSLSSKPKAEADPESNAAVLVSESSGIINQTSNPQVLRQDPLASVLEANVVPNPKALRAALEAKPTTVRSDPTVKSRPVSTTKNFQRASNKPVKTANASKTPVVKKAVIVSAPKAGSKSTTLAGKKQPTVVLKKTPSPGDTIARQMDGDVNLISALVSHSIENEQKQLPKSVRNPVPTTK